MKLHELQPPKGSKSERRRIGRGLGSGRGKTAGKGTKGQKARSGGGVPLYFEGGQLPLVRRLPYRRGFNNPFRIEYEVVNLDQLDGLDAGTSVTPELLRAAGLVRRNEKPVKVLARGTLSKALTVRADAFSEAAEAAITKAGGKIDLIPGKVRPPAPRRRPEGRVIGKAKRAAPSVAPDDDATVRLDPEAAPGEDVTA